MRDYEQALRALSYKQLCAVLKHLRNGSIGFDPNRNDETNSKAKLVEHILYKGRGNWPEITRPPTTAELENALTTIVGSQGDELFGDGDAEGDNDAKQQTAEQAKTYTEWLQEGRIVQHGQKATGRTAGNIATFTRDQTKEHGGKGKSPKAADKPQNQGQQQQGQGEGQDEQQQPQQEPDDFAGALAKAAELAKAIRSSLDENRVKELAQEVFGDEIKPFGDAMESMAGAIKTLEESGKLAPTRVIVENKTTEQTQDMGIQHKQFPVLLKLLACRTFSNEPLNVWLTGPAGSGKTTAVRNAATALSLPFFFNGAIDNEYKLLGFTDAQGRIVSRPFREVWQNGGVYLFDEVDASLPAALLAFNAALANGRCDFPDGCHERHKDCIIVAAANTFGQGATADYVGRVKQDAAFLDRFVQLAWTYDEQMESALCSNAEWCATVQKLRKKAFDIGLKVIISPRATMFGEAMLAGGFSREDTMAMAIRKGMTNDQWKSLVA